MLGVDATLVGRATNPAGSSRLPFPRQAISSFGSVLLQKPDLLHINYALFGFVAIAKPGLPTVLHFHGEDIRGPGRLVDRLVSRISRLNARWASAVWHSTPDLGPILRRAGVTSRYMPNPVSSAFFETALGPPEKPTVLFAVPLSEIKGAQFAIRAMRLLAEAKPRPRILAFGFGPNAAEVARLRRGFPKSIEVLPWTEHSSLPGLLREVSVVVGQLNLGILSLLELESMAAGRAVVMKLPASLRAAEPYYGDDPPVLSCSTPTEIVSTVQGLLDDEVRLVALSAEARRWASRYHSASVVAHLYAEEYSKLMVS